LPFFAFARLYAFFDGFCLTKLQACLCYFIGHTSFTLIKLMNDNKK